MKTIPSELLDNQVEHRYGGCGWVVVQELPDEMCRVTNFSRDDKGKYHLGTQLFLAWVKLLKPWKIPNAQNQFEIQAIPSGVQEQVNTLRNAFLAGEMTVNNTRITKA